MGKFKQISKECSFNWGHAWAFCWLIEIEQGFFFKTCLFERQLTKGPYLEAQMEEQDFFFFVFIMEELKGMILVINTF